MHMDIMVKKMLIDATHPEETRVVVVDGNKVEEFDFESENKRQLAGNIYLAKVTRVEPSLQAAFVDYGGNRHGFLAFAEIHPDYYQIPVADRIALMEEERAYAEAQRAREEGDSPRRSSSRGSAARDAQPDSMAARNTMPDAIATADVAGMETIDLGDDTAEAAMTPDAVQSPMERVAETPVEEPTDAGPDTPNADATDEPVAVEADPDTGADPVADLVADPVSDLGADDTADVDPDADTGSVPAQDAADDHDHDHGNGHDNHDHGNGHDAAPDRREARYASDKDSSIESVGDDDDDFRSARKPRPRRYKIQEVIKVRQIMLVQVVKEERGNKGAALTTYLSLAGRYCVLMPNSERGGGISRKITNAADRKKLKEIAEEMQLPRGAGLIVRTAGAQRTKTEIKRDYEYLLRLWEQIRELTLKSIAPAKIYEEGDLIKRTIRDLYSSEIDEVLVEGERGFRNARDFMKMIMPTSAGKVKLYREPMPLFARFQVESYLSSMFNPTVQLKSGGYIVIGVTEALVAIDVNSGRATKEGSIEETAVKTNLEAADEVARQLRLRDLAGLIVIDFIDMDDRKNNAAVEKRMKDRLKTDRARIQIGRISGFGLMEMSRQRLRPGMIEATTQPCAHCHGTGLVRSDDNLALSILRQIDEEGTRRRSREVLVRAPVAIANYLMNHKREHVATIEARYGMSVRVEGDPALISPDFTLEKFKTATRVVPESHVVQADASLMDEVDEASAAEIVVDEAEVIEDVVAATPATAPDASEGGESKPKKKRRRRRRKSSTRPVTDAEGNLIEAADTSDADDSDADDDGDDDAADTATAVVADEPATDAAPAKKTVTRSSSSRSSSSRSKAKPAADAPAPVAAEDSSPETVADDAAAETVTEPVKKPSSRSRSSKSATTPKTPSTRSSTSRTKAKTAATADTDLAQAADGAETAEIAVVAVTDAVQPDPVPVAAEEVAVIVPAVAPELAAVDSAVTAAEPAPVAMPDTVMPDSVTPDSVTPEQVAETVPETVTAPAPVPEPVMEPVAVPTPVAETVIAAETPSEPPKPKKRGWWNLGG